jgi:phosphoribosylformylglycinamidine synthase
MTERVTVQVWLKEAVLDPQGQAVQKALTREGLPGVKSVRQGKVFFIEFEDESGKGQEDLNQLIEKLARDLLSNPVIEDFQVIWPSEPDARVIDYLEGDA